jgi:hypothetical protein
MRSNFRPLIRDVYLLDRYYDPTTGQFLTVDPNVAQTGQPYAYTGDNPVNETAANGTCVKGLGFLCKTVHVVAHAADVTRHANTGEAICADWLSRTVTAYVRAGAPQKRGSCHLFRHTAATLMLEGGADICYVAEMLGHAKLETTAMYTRVSIAKLRAVHQATHPTGR